MPTRHPLLSILLIGLMALLTGCAEEPVIPDTSIVNDALAVRLSEAPEGLQVTLNEGAKLELTPSGEGGTGSIAFRVGPEETGINLVAAMKEHQHRIESLDSGDYKGGQELAGPLGTAFYSRGLYRDGGATIEETSVFTIHPNGTRLLEIRYVYPAAGDSAARVNQLLGVLALVDAPSPPGA